MPELEILHSKEQLFLLDLSQEAEKRCCWYARAPFYTPELRKTLVGFARDGYRVAMTSSKRCSNVVIHSWTMNIPTVALTSYVIS